MIKKIDFSAKAKEIEKKVRRIFLMKRTDWHLKMSTDFTVKTIIIIVIGC